MLWHIHHLLVGLLLSQAVAGSFWAWPGHHSSPEPSCCTSATRSRTKHHASTKHKHYHSVTAVNGSPRSRTRYHSPTPTKNQSYDSSHYDPSPNDSDPNDSDPYDNSLNNPTTDNPTTDNPTTDDPFLDNPSLDNPTTNNPTTDNPTTDNPTTDNPTTDNPTTDNPSTNNPTTDNPTTDNPTTDNPTTDNTELTFINWSTFKANGVNLGAWLAQERTHDPVWWDSHAPDTADEWSFCAELGDECGPVLEQRYATYITTADIDSLAAVGVNVLRIPTTYAAWIRVPGSNFYTGNQTLYLSRIAMYGIETYGMHVIIDLHSLPGGVNSLDIGEALGHKAWFNNDTNLAYSLSAIDEILTFIQASAHLASFTIAPINEASDNLTGFGTSAGLTANGTAWINTYIHAVLERVAGVDERIPVMLQDCFQSADFWAPYYANGTNLVIDSHVYYFAAAGVYARYVTPAICGQASSLLGAGKFPVFVGEWSLQTQYNNTFADRQEIFDTERYAWQAYVSGGAFWTARSKSTTLVSGEGTQADYWSYLDLIEDGVIVPQTNETYCSAEDMAEEAEELAASEDAM